MRKKSKKKGFTLTEIIAAVIIVGVILLIAVPAFSNLLERFKKEFYDKKFKTVEVAANNYLLDHKKEWPTESLYSNYYELDNPLVKEKYIKEEALKKYRSNDKCEGHFVKIKAKGDYITELCMKCEEDYQTPKKSSDNQVYCDSSWLNNENIDTSYNFGEKKYVYYKKEYTKAEKRNVMSATKKVVKQLSKEYENNNLVEESDKSKYKSLEYSNLYPENMDTIRFTMPENQTLYYSGLLKYKYNGGTAKNQLYIYRHDKPSIDDQESGVRKVDSIYYLGNSNELTIKYDKITDTFIRDGDNQATKLLRFEYSTDDGNSWTKICDKKTYDRALEPTEANKSCTFPAKAAVGENTQFRVVGIKYNEITNNYDEEPGMINKYTISLGEEVDNPDDYCAKPIYKGTLQSLVTLNPIGVEYEGTTTATDYKTNGYNIDIKTKNGYVWPDGTKEVKTIKCNITRINIKLKAEDIEETYTGSEINVTTDLLPCKVTSGSIISGETAKCKTKGTATNAGTHDSAISDVEIKNSSGTSKLINYIIEEKQKGKFTINQKPITIENTCKTLTFNGSSQKLVNDKTFTWYTWDSSSSYATSAGSHKVYGVLEDSANTKWSGNNYITCSIGKLSIPIENTCKTLTFNGSSQKLVNDPTSKWYTWNTSSKTNAGTYTVSGTLIDSSNTEWKDGKSSISCSIGKKSVEVSWSNLEFDADDNNHKPTASVNTGVSSESMNLDVAPSAKDPGTYNSTATCSSVTGGQASCSNYTLTNDSVDWEIIDPDTEAPTCSITVYSPSGAGDKFWFKDDVELRMTTKDNKGVTTYGLDTSTNSDNEKTSIKFTTDGVYTAYGYVKDAAGNEGSCEYSIGIDKTAPSLLVTKTYGGYTSYSGQWTKENVYMNAWVKDSGSGIASVKYGNNDFEIVESKAFCDTYYLDNFNTYDYRYLHTFNYSINQTFTVTVKDNLGNTTTSSGHEIKVDRENPQCGYLQTNYPYLINFYPLEYGIDASVSMYYMDAYSGVRTHSSNPSTAHSPKGLLSALIDLAGVLTDVLGDNISYDKLQYYANQTYTGTVTDYVGNTGTCSYTTGGPIQQPSNPSQQPSTTQVNKTCKSVVVSGYDIKGSDNWYGGTYVKLKATWSDNSTKEKTISSSKSGESIEISNGTGYEKCYFTLNFEHEDDVVAYILDKDQLAEVTSNQSSSCKPLTYTNKYTLTSSTLSDGQKHPTKLDGDACYLHHKSYPIPVRGKTKSGVQAWYSTRVNSNYPSKCSSFKEVSVTQSDCPFWGTTATTEEYKFKTVAGNWSNKVTFILDYKIKTGNCSSC